MRAPNYITSLAMHNLIDCTYGSNSRYPARPSGMPGNLGRWRLAWWVLIGKADALVWIKPPQD